MLAAQSQLHRMTKARFIRDDQGVVAAKITTLAARVARLQQHHQAAASSPCLQQHLLAAALACLQQRVLACSSACLRAATLAAALAAAAEAAALAESVQTTPRRS